MNFQAHLQKHYSFTIPTYLHYNSRYASLNINVTQCTLISSPLFFHFMIDCSGSMNDKCNDGYTKMQTTIHTLSNMIKFFAENDNACIYCQIDAFDNDICNVLELIQITKETIQYSIQQLDKLHPGNSTNIEIALQHSMKVIENYSKNNINHRIAHIFMTDGDATSGKCDPTYLASIINNNNNNNNEASPKAPTSFGLTPLHIENAQSASPRSLITAPEGGVLNVQRWNTNNEENPSLPTLFEFNTNSCNSSNSFIAFGIHHNHDIMDALGRATNKCSNWLIEKLENAGLVYGEILNNELYVGAENVVIKMINGLIYDYKLGQFVDTLDINTLVTETQKNYHVISDDIDNCQATIQGKYIHNGETFEEIVLMLPSLLDYDNDLHHCTFKSPSIGRFISGMATLPCAFEMRKGVSIVPNDLTKEIFRLHTQQLMHKVLLFNKNNNYRAHNHNYMNCSSPKPKLRRRNTQTYVNNFIDNDENVSTVTTEILHLCTFKTPPSGAVMSERGDADCTFEMCNGVNHLKNTETSDINELKITLTDFHKVMLDYIKNNELENDTFMKGLSDDIYIAIRTIGTPNQQMYVSARETSQGRQQTYNITDIIFDQNYNHFTPLHIENASNDTDIYSQETYLPPYQLQQKSINTSYSTPNILRTIRSITG